MRSPLVRGHLGGYTLSFFLDGSQAPLSVSWLLYQEGTGGDHPGTWFRSTLCSNFSLPVGMAKGSPLPLGAERQLDGSINFALFSRAAEGVTLCLYRGEEPNPAVSASASAIATIL